MNNTDIMKLKLTDENNNIHEYEILLVFYSMKTNKNYIVYTDNTSDENGNLNIYASIYYPDDKTRLDNVETEEEWEEIERQLNEVSGSGQ